MVLPMLRPCDEARGGGPGRPGLEQLLGERRVEQSCAWARACVSVCL